MDSNYKELISENSNLCSWSASIREKALMDLESFEFPTRKWENWKYTDLKKLTAKQYSPKESSPIDITDSQDNSIIFENNKLIALPKAQGLIIKNLEDSIPEINHIKNSFDFSNPFDHLNLSQIQNGLYLKISKDYKNETPLKILTLGNQEKGVLNYLTIIIEIESGAIFDLIDTNHLSSLESHNNRLTLIKVSDNASFNHLSILDVATSSNFISNIKANIEKGAQYNNFTMGLSGELVRSEVTANLNGELSHCDLHGIYALNNEDHIANYTLIDHKAAHTTSDQLYKGLLNDSSHGVFNGRILVRKNSQQINSHQLNRNLLLSDKSKVDTKPQLEIYADDVKCAHGATTGQLTDDELFYLMTRGISKKRAKEILSLAFIASAIDKIKSSQLKEHAHSYLKENLWRRDYLEQR